MMMNVMKVISSLVLLILNLLLPMIILKQYDTNFFLSRAFTENVTNNDYIQMDDEEYDKSDVLLDSAHTEPDTNDE